MGKYKGAPFDSTFVILVVLSLLIVIHILVKQVVKILSNIMEGNGDTCIGFNTKGNNEDDKILGTETSSSFYTDRTCSSKRWSPSSSNSNHEENERKKIVLKRKGGTPNKSKLFYEEMIH